MSVEIGGQGLIEVLTAATNKHHFHLRLFFREACSLYRFFKPGRGDLLITADLFHLFAKRLTNFQLEERHP